MAAAVTRVGTSTRMENVALSAGRSLPGNQVRAPSGSLTTYTFPSRVRFHPIDPPVPAPGSVGSGSARGTPW